MAKQRAKQQHDREPHLRLVTDDFEPGEESVDTNLPPGLVPIIGEASGGGEIQLAPPAGNDSPNWPIEVMPSAIAWRGFKKSIAIECSPVTRWFKRRPATLRFANLALLSEHHVQRTYRIGVEAMRSGSVDAVIFRDAAFPGTTHLKRQEVLYSDIVACGLLKAVGAKHPVAFTPGFFIQDCVWADDAHRKSGGHSMLTLEEDLSTFAPWYPRAPEGDEPCSTFHRPKLAAICACGDRFYVQEPRVTVRLMRIADLKRHLDPELADALRHEPVDHLQLRNDGRIDNVLTRDHILAPDDGGIAFGGPATRVSRLGRRDIASAFRYELKRLFPVIGHEVELAAQDIFLFRADQFLVGFTRDRVVPRLGRGKWYAESEPEDIRIRIALASTHCEPAGQ